MCDACEPVLSRRAVLRGAVIGGAVLATASGTWSPTRAAAAADVMNGRLESTDLEQAAMAEDTAHKIPNSKIVRGTRQIAPPNTQGAPPPPILARAGWGADESIRVDDRAFAPVRKLIVHHSASANNPRNPADVVRFIQRYHTTGRGFSDTGYNYLIDHKGIIYEGRAARRYNTDEPISNEDNKGWGVVGAHAKRYNAGSCGVCLIGNFDTGSPTDAAISSLTWLLSYKASRYRIDALEQDQYIDLYGNHRTFPNIAGHRQVGLTACPGKRLYALLPTLREEVARRAGHWNSLTVDVPGVVRWEVGTLRAPGSKGSGAGSASTTPPLSASGHTAAGSAASGAAGSGTTAQPVSASSPGMQPGTGRKLVGVRVVSSNGQVFTAGSGRTHGNPAKLGSTKVVGMANSSSGDGYWALDQSGAVTAFGGVGQFGDATGKGVAADIAIAPGGGGYWILMADGGIYPFGSAGYASSPKKAGVGGTAKRIVARPQGDGYWVLMADGNVYAYGNAGQRATVTSAGSIVDIEVTPSGRGYWLLTETGVVAVFGDAVDKGDPKRSSVSWSKSPSHIVRTGSGSGYVVVNREGSMLAFGDAPLLTSFGGSGMTATGAAPVFG